MEQLLSCHLVIVAALTFFATDAQVSLVTWGTSQNSFICGEQQILNCTIEPYSNTMNWRKVNYTDILASCSPFTLICSPNPNVKTSYNFTFDTNKGVFQLIILKVKVSDNGTTYSCDNGVVTAQLISNITVKADSSIVKAYKTIDSNTTEVSVKTGCIQDNADIKFEWWLQKVNNNSSEKIKINESAPLTNRDNTACLADEDCGVSGYSFVTNSVNITDEGTGKKYRIGVDVTFDGITNTVVFDLFFTLNFPVSESQKTTECATGIYVAYTTIAVFYMSLVYVYLIYENSFWKNKACTFCLIALGGFPFVGLVVKVVLFINKRKPDNLQSFGCLLFVLISAISLTCEIFIILLCTVWSFPQWYALVLVLPDLICRWILCIIIAKLYNECNVFWSFLKIIRPKSAIRPTSYTETSRQNVGSAQLTPSND